MLQYAVSMFEALLNDQVLIAMIKWVKLSVYP